MGCLSEHRNWECRAAFLARSAKRNGLFNQILGGEPTTAAGTVYLGAVNSNVKLGAFSVRGCITNTARHHKEAAKHHEAGKHETAAHHAPLALR